MIILAIESSCDECSAALIDSGSLLALHTQTQTIHQHYGGVVPELAGRSHLELIDGIVTETFSKAGCHLQDIDLVAATIGPGLVGSLLVGSNYARGLALALGKHFRGIHHVEAHLWSAELESPSLPLPFLVLLASGGHTLLIMVHGLREYEILGSTRDDALGEAYDKVGKLEGFTFPAGGEVDRVAATGNPMAFEFPRAMDDRSYDFSFSGLKTAYLYKSGQLRGSSSNSADMLASFQEAALDSVMNKVRKAIIEMHPRALIAAGGVAANSRLRQKFSAVGDEYDLKFIFPTTRLCMDNAAMIGYLAWKLEAAGVSDSVNSTVKPRWPLELLPSLTHSTT